jgi:hypothetical protein
MSVLPRLTYGFLRTPRMGSRHSPHFPRPTRVRARGPAKEISVLGHEWKRRRVRSGMSVRGGNTTFV